MPSAKLYSAADIMKALPVLIGLRARSFKRLKEMYRAGGGPANGRHLSKRDCILFIAFGETEQDGMAMRISSLEVQLHNTKTKLATTEETLKAERSRADGAEKYGGKCREERDDARMKNEELLSTMRQLMRL